MHHTLLYHPYEWVRVKSGKKQQVTRSSLHSHQEYSRKRENKDKQ